MSVPPRCPTSTSLLDTDVPARSNGKSVGRSSPVVTVPSAAPLFMCTVVVRCHRPSVGKNSTDMRALYLGSSQWL